MSSHRPKSDDRGAVAIMVGVLAMVLLGMAAFTVDLGAQFSARRQTQSAADAGVLAGTQEAGFGIAGVSDRIARTVRTNIPRTYTDADWFALWSTANCSDVDAYEISGIVNGATTNCVSFDPSGIVRVRVPDVEVDTVFAGILGVTRLDVTATAEARLSMPGGVLPFAMLSGSSDGGEMCLKTASSGQAFGPCDGPDSGNFGALLSSIYGSLEHGTQGINCNTINNGDNLIVNASVGVDHMLLAHDGTDVFDTCSRAIGPNTLETITGNNSPDVMDGLVNGATVSGTDFAGLLTKTANATVEIRNGGSNINDIDNRPLWEYIPTGKAAAVPGGVPASCTRESLDATLAASGPEDTTAQLITCLEEYADDPSGLGYGVLFDLDVAPLDYEPDLIASPRFGYVPRMRETSFPSGSSGWLSIDSFQAVYVQTLYFGCNGTGCSDIVYPGIDETSINVGGGASVLDQVSSLVLPKGSIPISLEYDTEILDFTTPELVR